MKKITLLIVILVIISGCRTSKNFWQSDNSYESIYNAGVKEMDNKKYNGALRHFQSIVEEGKNDPILHLVMGLCNAYMDSYRDAVRHFVRASELEDHKSIWGNLGNVYSEMGLDSLALDCYEKALDMDWQYAHALQNKAALISWYNDRREEAEDLYNEAILNNEELPEPWYNLGVIYEKKEEYEGALECFDQALIRNSSYQKAIIAKSSLLKTMGQPIPVDELQKVLNRDKKVDDNLLNLDGAFSKYRVHQLLGNIEGEKKYYAIALAKLNELIEKYPLAYRLYAQRGHIQEEQQDIDAAIADYKKVLELNPLLADARNGLKSILNTNIKK